MQIHSTSWLYAKPEFTYDSLRAEHESLTEAERRRILQERYGFEDEIIETPELVSRALVRLEEAIDAIDEKEAYETALFINPAHVQSDIFRLAFLRTENYDANATARRIVDYWERKVELFGTAKAFRNYISLSDFCPKDQNALAKGGLRLLPYRDDRGRAILFSFSAYYDSDVESMVKELWFMFHKAIEKEDETTDAIQKKGVVFLLGNGRPTKSPSPFHNLEEHKRFIKESTRDGSTFLPIRNFSIHYFSPNVWVARMLEHLLPQFGQKCRHRMIVHSSTNKTENLAKLAECGISPDIVPRELGGELNFDYQGWLSYQLFEEQFDAGVDLEEET
eukprot:CAMPEP_0195282380 /NCGR_PEP_ID=MMETSP0707-20130614/1274_1 /TAXON_ID=33640 /ORGANISM="Asterionellopsis glacialis, Strain CCMP134" /LENGTH=334 /DNA_ID=CAMNT_0040341345 /DNA_START=51 /DNA_END=1058 /DNA_ORIENTATION=+